MYPWFCISDDAVSLCARSTDSCSLIFLKSCYLVSKDYSHSYPQIRSKIHSLKQVGAWRDRIILYSGTYGPTPAIVKAFLDSGAKAVIGPSTEPQVTMPIPSQGSAEYNVGETGRFEIGEDEEEEEAEEEANMEPPTPTSDWEDSDNEKTNSEDKFIGVWEDEEEEVSQFVCKLYDLLFRENSKVDVAVQRALSLHRKLRYTCHLPSV